MDTATFLNTRGFPPTATVEGVLTIRDGEIAWSTEIQECRSIRRMPMKDFYWQIWNC